MLEYNKKKYFIFQVSELTTQLKSMIEVEFSYVEVEGEVSGLVYHTSGHIYFSLKDDYAVLSCTFFRNNAKNNPLKLKNGDKIIAKGNLSVYPPKGTYNLNVIKCEYSGVGNLKMQYDLLKKELESKNYFSKNKQLPRFPKRIILLTSQTSAALQDMIKVASKRFCNCEFILIDTLTQGKEAKYSIAKNLAYADRLNADIIVLARGGGSIEDLWSFNEIEVLEAIFSCKTLIVSAIGHEIDYLLSDYVADVRAPTPSAAMEIILQDKNALINQLIDMEIILKNKILKLMESKKEIMANTKQNIQLLNPKRKINELRQILNSIDNELNRTIYIFLLHNKNMINQLREHINIINPIQKIRNFKNTLESVSVENIKIYNSFICNKKEQCKQLNILLISNIKILITKKQVPNQESLNETAKYFVERKKDELSNLSSILNTLNPTNKLKLGLAQILKNDKPIQLKDLKQGDIIELVDSSGIASAQIINTNI